MRESRVLIAFVLAALTPLSTSAPRGSESFSALASAAPAAPPTGAVIIPTAAGAAGAAAAECTLPVIPDEYTVAGVPNSDDFQVLPLASDPRVHAPSCCQARTNPSHGKTGLWRGGRCLAGPWPQGHGPSGLAGVAVE